MNSEILKKIKTTANVKVGNKGELLFYVNNKFQKSKTVPDWGDFLSLKFSGSYQIFDKVKDKYGKDIGSVLKIQVDVANTSNIVTNLSTFDLEAFDCKGKEICILNEQDYFDDVDGFSLTPNILPGGVRRENVYIQYNDKYPMLVIAVSASQFVAILLNDGSDEIAEMIK